MDSKAEKKMRERAGTCVQSGMWGRLQTFTGGYPRDWEGAVAGLPTGPKQPFFNLCNFKIGSLQLPELRNLKNTTLSDENTKKSATPGQEVPILSQIF